MDPETTEGTTPDPDLGRMLAAYEALLAFFRAHLPEGRTSLAEDLTQQTILGSWRVWSRNRAEIDDLGRHLLGIARHKLTDALRDPYWRHEVPLAPDVALPRRSSDSNPEVAPIGEERHRQLVTAICALRDREREILRLRFDLELDDGEAARRLGLPPDEASRLKYRALSKLRARMRKISRDRPRVRGPESKYGDPYYW